MDIILSLLVLFAVIITLACKRTPVLIWTGVIGLVLVIYTFFGMMPYYLLIPCWLIYLGAAAIFNFPEIRQRYVTRKLYNYVKQNLPSMSQTEKEALDAGDVWLEGGLFKGEPDWQKLDELKISQLSAEESSFINNQVNTLCKMLDDWQIVHEDKDLPPQVWQYLKDEKFFGLCINKKYGGLAFSAYAHSFIISKVASRSFSAAVTLMVPNSLGPAELIQHYGTEEQKDYYLPRLARGEEIPCFGLTAPEAGSDAASIPDTGVVCKGMYQGKEVLGIRLNFDKRYITLAPVATLMGLAFKLYDPDKLVGDKVNIGITVCLLPANLPGIEKDTRHLPMDLAFMNGPIRGKNVFIPLDFIVGGSTMMGQGWRMLMECLSMGRGISLPSLAAAAGEFAFRVTGAYARVRQQFHVPIADFEGVQEALSRIAGYTYMLEASRALTVQAVDFGIRPAIVSAIAKYNMTEISRSVMNDAFDIHAGKAIQIGPNNYLAHAYLGMPISITVEGANILTRNLIVFGQGAMRCHPYIRQEIDAVSDPDTTAGFNKFDQLICQHLGYTVNHFARAIYYGITGGAFIKAGDEKNPLAKYRRNIARMSNAFALAADVSMMVLGGELKRKEKLSARLADILSQLYLAMSIVKYYDANEKTADSLVYAEWGLQICLHKIQIAFDDLCYNFPNKALGVMLNLVIFPIDRSFKHAPSDELSQKLLNAILTNNPLRDQLTRGVFIDSNEKDAVAVLEEAFKQVLLCQPIEQKIHQALHDKRIKKYKDRATQLQIAFDAKIISTHEMEMLAKLADKVAQVIAVDEFTLDQIQGKATCKPTQTVKVA